MNDSGSGLRCQGHPPKGPNGHEAAAKRDRRWLTLTTLCLAVLIAQIDTSVVNLAIRPIGVDLGASLAALQWIVDSYNLVYAVLLLTGGLLADLYGRRLVFMAGTAIFTVASLFCALAPDSSMLIASRALTGLGAALLLPASVAIIRVVWRKPAERGRALGIWASCNGLALAIGPTVGGLLIGSLGWRSIFLLVIPVGVAVLALAVPAIPETSDPQERRFDATAQILGAIALGGLALAAIEVQEARLVAFGAFVVALLCLLLFFLVERRTGAQALVPLNMFATREFSGAVAATAAMTFGMYGALFLVPLTWQSTGMLGSAGAGVALVPMALLFVVVSPLSGALTETVGARLMTSGGVAVIGCGLLVVAATAGWNSIAGAEIGLALTGTGMGLATGPLFGVATGAVSPTRSGTAAALINVARMTGATIGVAVLGAVFAAAQGGAAGLAVSMLLGALVQIAGAGAAWHTVARKP